MKKADDEHSYVKPHVMPVDSAEWGKRLSISNFVNSYYAYQDVSSLVQCGKILIIGPGQGLDVIILKWRDFEVVTLDIDPTFEPDYVASVNDMRMFKDQQFDIVLVSHVLEHIPVSYLDKSLHEISRVGKYALVYLPVAGRHSQLRWKVGIKGFDWSIILDLFNFMKEPSGEIAKYCGGQHYWELGMKGYRRSDIRKRFMKYFNILDSYRNSDWNPSYNFILQSRDSL